MVAVVADLLRRIERIRQTHRVNEIDVHAAAIPLPDDVAAGVASSNARRD